MPYVNKNNTSEKWKFNSNKKLDLEWALNGKTFRKKSDPKNEKTVKIRVKLPHVKKNHYRETEFLFKHRFLTLF